MDSLNLNERDKDYLIGLVLELNHKLSKKRATAKKFQTDLEAARRSNQQLKEKITYLRSRIVEHHAQPA